MMAKNALVGKDHFGELLLRSIWKNAWFCTRWFFLVDFSLPGIFVAQLLDVLEVSISSKPLAILVLKLCLAAVQRNSLDCNAGIHIHQRLPFGHRSSFMVLFGVLVSNIKDRAHFCNSCMCPTNNGVLRLKLRRYLSPWIFFQVLQFGNCGHFWPGTFELGGSWNGYYHVIRNTMMM